MKATIIQNENEEPIAVEILADAILDISKAMKRIENSRLSRKALLVLISHNAKISMRDVEIILNNLDLLEKTWLKPKGRAA